LASALNRVSGLALMLGAEPASASRGNLQVRRHETAQIPHILVVHHRSIVGAIETSAGGLFPFTGFTFLISHYHN